MGSKLYRTLREVRGPTTGIAEDSDYEQKKREEKGGTECQAANRQEREPWLGMRAW